MTEEGDGIEGKARHLTVVREGESYIWLTADDLLLLRPEKPVGAEVVDPRTDEALEQAQSLTHTAHRLTLSNGQVTPLTEFNRQQAAFLQAEIRSLKIIGDPRPAQVKHDPPHVALSPDGQWLLWTLGEPATWRAARIDGSETVEWPEVPGNYKITVNDGIWLPESPSWYELLLRKGGRTNYAVRRLRKRRVDDPTALQDMQIFGMDEGLPCGITERSSLVMHYPVFPDRQNTKPQAQAAFSELVLSDSPEGVAHNFEVALPAPGWVWRVRVSPEGKRLAWLIQDGSFGRKRYSLWISDLQGNQCQEIGRVQGRSVTPYAGSDLRYAFPRDPQWSPDGRWISFLYGEEVWALEVS